MGVRATGTLGTAVALLLAGGAQAQTFDLVAHNGFEACWSQALTKPAFLTLLQTSIDGRTSCLPQSTGTGYTACYTAACPGNTIGCPVTVHAGAFSGDFDSGVFSAPGTVDDITIPVNFGFTQCVVTITNIGVTYAPTFYVTPDGNLGDYMADITAASVVTIDSDTVGGTGSCGVLAGSLADTVKAAARDQATAQMIATLRASAAGQSVCPLVP